MSSALIQRTSLRQRVNRLLIIGAGLQLLLIVLAGGTAVLGARNSLRASADRGAQVAAAGVLAGMADQQSGLLAYVDSAEPEPLLLYQSGRQETDTAVAALRADTTGTGASGQASHVEQAARSWESWAESMRQRVAAAGSEVTDPTAGNEGRRRFAVFRQSQRQLIDELRADSAASVSAAIATTLAKMVVTGGCAVAVGALLWITAQRVVRQGLEPLRELAGVAMRVATGVRAAIPHGDRGDEVGELARALQGWQEAAAVRAVLLKEAPVGICRIDRDGRLLTTNAALESMLGYRGEELVGRAFWTLVHPDHQAMARRNHNRLIDGELHDLRLENRWLRRDGSVIWFAMVATPLPGPDGRAEALIGIMEDITERKRQAERAAQIQRDLLPGERPTVEGYELAGACLAAQEVGGGLYDWVGPGPEGHLDLTVAHAKGMGVGAALVMMTLRAVLRSAPAELGPAARARLAAESMSRGLTDEGLFVTLFHARLEVGTGRLRYVDAGHGHWLVRRADGTVVTLGERSLPLGVGDGEYAEGQVELGPGDTLLVYTDGLVEAGDETLGPGELAGELVGLEDAEEMVERLVDRVRGQLRNDVTVVALHRQGCLASQVRC